jgi:hypothetical protein
MLSDRKAVPLTGFICSNSHVFFLRDCDIVSTAALQGVA